MSAAFEIVQPGMFATVQDLGRWGQQASGMVVSGAMDAYALQCGNALVGNPRNAAALEFAVRGPHVRVLRETVIAVCGADLNAMKNGRPLPRWKSVRVPAGSELSFGSPNAGVFAYLCVSGGIDVPALMESRSTYARAGIGGLEGRMLRAGDVLKAGTPGPFAREGRWVAPSDTPVYATTVEVRAVPGPQEELFPRESFEAFYTLPYARTAQSDRMGYRLSGETLHLRQEGGILSEAVAVGSVQVPPDGQPIVLMAERQTTGGYAKIATVISADIPRLAQLSAGGTVRFRYCTLEEAQEVAADRERFFIRLYAGCGVHA